MHHHIRKKKTCHVRTRLDRYVNEYKTAPESGSLGVPPSPAGGAGALGMAKGGALFNSLLWGWLLGCDVSSIGSWVSTEKYGVETEFMQHVKKIHVPDPSQVGINWSANA